MSADPMAIMTTVSLGLKVIDQFRELALRLRGKPAMPPGAVVEQAGDVLQVRHNGAIAQEIHGSDLRLDFWDETRYRALKRRTELNWQLLQEYDAQNVAVTGAEKAIINVRMHTTEDELCDDFREMVRIYERALNTSLPDHYQLYEVCKG